MKPATIICRDIARLRDETSDLHLLGILLGLEVWPFSQLYPIICSTDNLVIVGCDICITSVFEREMGLAYVSVCQLRRVLKRICAQIVVIAHLSEVYLWVDLIVAHLSEVYL